MIGTEQLFAGTTSVTLGRDLFQATHCGARGLSDVAIEEQDELLMTGVYVPVLILSERLPWVW